MKVKFLPTGQELEIKQNQSVLDLAHQNGIHIQSICKGVPSCAECRVQIKRGEHNVIPPSPAELSLIGTAQFVDNSRLACQLKCFGDIEVDLSEQIEKEKRVLDSKKPRGAEGKREGSSAVTGNLVLQEAGRYSDLAEREVAKQILNEEIQAAKQRLRDIKKNKGQNQNHNKSQNQNKNQNRQK
ncbi:MAG: (2Fe-2S)-binding protein [Bdellovibrionales bacterium]|nr:(2Fe-2S)-binding protein [Bdellovibrionales bacterium]